MTKNIQEIEVDDSGADKKDIARHPAWSGMSQTIVIISLFILAFMLTRWLAFDDMIFGETFFLMLIIQGVTLGYGLFMWIFPNAIFQDKSHRIEKVVAFVQLGMMCLIEIVNLFCMVLIYAATSSITL